MLCTWACWVHSGRIYRLATTGYICIHRLALTGYIRRLAVTGRVCRFTVTGHAQRLTVTGLILCRRAAAGRAGRVCGRTLSLDEMCTFRAHPWARFNWVHP